MFKLATQPIFNQTDAMGSELFNSWFRDQTFRPRHYLHSTHKSHCKSWIEIKRKHATVCRTLGYGHGHLRVVEQWVMTLSCCWVKNLLPSIWLAVTIRLSLEAQPPQSSWIRTQMTWRGNLSVGVICYNH